MKKKGNGIKIVILPSQAATCCGEAFLQKSLSKLSYFYET